MKKLVSLFVVLAMVLSLGVSAMATHPTVTVYVDGVEVLFDQAPVIENGRTLVPVRAIAEKLGAHVDWDEDDRTAVIIKDETVITMTIDQEFIMKDGEAIVVDQPPVIRGDRTLIPCRALAEALDCKVDWDGEGYRVFVTTVITEAEAAPVIFHITDEVKPGNSFTVTGWDISSETVLYVEKAERAGKTPSKNATILPPTLTDTLSTQYAIAILPEDLAPGVYKVWAKNDKGISEPVLLNAPRIHWVAESDIAWEGQTVQIVGVDFTADRFGGENNTKVKIAVGGREYDCKITDLKPYSIDFVVPKGVRTGECDIYVTNDGKNWSVMDNEQTFSIVKKGNDPYGLDVAWADYYEYDYKINIKDFGAKGDGVTDDTAAFESAMNNIRENGGGVVYLPVGTYNVSKIEMPSRVIFEGEDREKSIINSICTDTSAQFIASAEDSLGLGYQGFYNLTITKDESTKGIYPDCQMWVGHQWTPDGPAYYRSLNTFSGFFMKSVTWDTPLEFNEKGRGLWYAIGVKYFMVDDYKASGYKTNFMPIQMDYATVRNTEQTPVTSSNESLGLYTVYEDNIINLQTQLDQETSAYAQGIFLRSHCYIDNNQILNTGRPGKEAPKSNFDGEIFATENSSIAAIRVMGTVEKAEGTTITVEPTLNADGTIRYKDSTDMGLRDDVWSPAWGMYYVMIVGGKGAGQLRIMTDHDGMNFTIDREWDVVPDETSAVQVGCMTQKSIYYNNYAENCEKGMWFYGGMYDSVMADNKLVDSEGLMSLSYHVPEKDMLYPVYFISYIGNELTGGARIGNNLPVSIRAQQELRDGYEDYKMQDLMGCIIRDTVMYDSMGPVNKEEKFTEGDAINGITIGVTYPRYAPWEEPLAPGITKALVVENNSLTNVADGIIIRGTGVNGTSGVLVKGNTYSGEGKTLVVTSGVDNMVVIEE